jgi:hypothetical protein
MRSLWYLPPHFMQGHDALAVVGTGARTGQLFAHSADIAVVPGAMYRVAVTVDTRAARGRACFYLAARPSGKDLGLSCAATGTVRSYALSSYVPLDVAVVQWTAVFNGTILDGRVVEFERPSLEVTRYPNSENKELLSN